MHNAVNPIVYQKILVPLDLTLMDQRLIQLSAFIADNGEVKEIHFVHVMKDFNLLSEESKMELPNGAIPPFKDAVTDLIKKKVDEFYKGKNPVDITVEVILSKQIVASCIKYAEENDIDLIVVGRKSDLKDSTMMPFKLANTATRSVLIAPEKSKTLEFNRILVPIDLSDHCKFAIRRAINIAKKHPNDVDIIAHNVFQIPDGYHYSGKDQKGFAEVMKKNIEREYNKFMEDVNPEGTHIRPIYSAAKDNDLVKEIFYQARLEDVGLIVMGARGRTKISAFIKSSLGVKMARYSTDYPILITRKKFANAGVFDTLKSI